MQPIGEEIFVRNRPHNHPPRETKQEKIAKNQSRIEVENCTFTSSKTPEVLIDNLDPNIETTCKSNISKSVTNCQMQNDKSVFQDELGEKTVEESLTTSTAEVMSSCEMKKSQQNVSPEPAKSIISQKEPASTLNIDVKERKTNIHIEQLSGSSCNATLTSPELSTNVNQNVPMDNTQLSNLTENVPMNKIQPTIESQQSNNQSVPQVYPHISQSQTDYAQNSNYFSTGNRNDIHMQNRAPYGARSEINSTNQHFSNFITESSSTSTTQSSLSSHFPIIHKNHQLPCDLPKPVQYSVSKSQIY